MLFNYKSHENVYANITLQFSLTINQNKVPIGMYSQKQNKRILKQGGQTFKFI